MPLRLSELLERIRPAGTPGAPAEGEQVRQRSNRDRELVDVLAVVASIEREAAEIVDAAGAEAERIHRDAVERTRIIRAGRDDQVAAAGAEAAQHDDALADVVGAAIADSAAQERDELRSRADILIPDLVRRATESIWTTIVPEARIGGRR